jgi:FkbM family methyltransferase
MSAMTPEDFVKALYRSVLGREADPGGLEHFSTLIRDTGDHTDVLKRLLESPEYAKRNQGLIDDAIRSASLEILGGREITIVDIGAQMLNFERHIYQPLIRADIPHSIIGFEPLADKLEERQSAEGSGFLKLLPYAIGDGDHHTLYVNNEDATSSLFPLNRALLEKFEHLHTLHLVSERHVTTRKLDDVLEDRVVDFLKLDIQGAELLALQGAGRTLQRTAVVHCEVEFASLYEGQCLFCEVQDHLVGCGFSLIDILTPYRYAYLNRQAVDSRDRLLWGEAIYFRDTDDAPTLAAQALIASLVYRKPSFAQHLIDSARDCMG